MYRQVLSSQASNPNPQPADKDNSRRRAMVIIAVLVVVVILSLAGYRYADLMMAEYEAAHNIVRGIQARSLAKSGVNYAAAVLSDPNTFMGLLNDNPFDNPTAFSNIMVLPEELGNGSFSIVSPPQPGNFSEGTTYYGVIDETAKINLNAMMKVDSKGDKLFEMLKNLPAMDESIAAAIVDWLDEDEEPRAGGAESSTYSGRIPPYRAKNGPLDSIEELLLVEGVTPELLFGNDLNRNGIIDAGETSTDPLMDRGWAAYLTIYSREQNVDREYLPRIQVNDKDLTLLYDKLVPEIGEEMATYIMLARLYGVQSLEPQTSTTFRLVTISSSDGGGGGGQVQVDMQLQLGGGQSSNNNNKKTVTSEEMPIGELDLTQEPKKEIKSLFDLVNSKVSVPGDGETIEYLSPLNDETVQREYMPILFDKVTTNKKTEIPARININTAPEAVIACLPDLELEDVQQIMATRPPVGSPTLASEVYQSPSWLITEANIKPQTVKKLEPYITTRSQVYRVQVIGFFEAGGPMSRTEAVIDTNLGRPRILYFRDLSSLGKVGGITPGQ